MTDQEDPSWLLGLDIGTDSIGWAVFACTEAPQVPRPLGFLDGGVRLFDSGRDPKEQTSLQADRGLKRRARRQPRARRWRLAQLRAALHAGGVAPGNARLDVSPYAIRAKAVNDDLGGEALWHALLHIARHRGFRSNRLKRRDDETAPTRTKTKPKKAAPEDEDAGFWEEAEQTLRDRMGAAGMPTIGALLAAELAAGRPVRMRYNRRGPGEACAPTRALIAEELDQIIKRQRALFPALDWPRVRSLILDQRPLRTKGGGPCEFFPEEPRTWRAMPSAQAFLVRQTLSNLRLPVGKLGEDRPLETAEYTAALALLSEHRALDWPALRKAIGLKGVKFTIELSGGKAAARRVEGNQTDAILGPLVPGWGTLDLHAKDRLFGALWSERQDRSRLVAAAADLAGADTAEAIADAIQFELPTGRLGLSLKAARLIVPCLEPGVPVHVAIKAATGRDHSDRRPQQRLARLPYYAEAMPDVGLDGSHDPAERNDPEAYFGRVANISVHIALNEVRKLVNALLERYGHGPRLIVVETTRELKAGADDRKRMVREQAAREAENAAIDAELRKSDLWLANARERRRRWRLAKRQAYLCPYSGERIGLADLLTDAYEIDHVIPRAMGGRDSEDNMVLCRAAFNRSKGNRTPWEAFHANPGWPDHRDRFLGGLDKDTRKALEWRFAETAAARAKRLGSDADDDGEGFLPRQLTDTGYIARTALRYLLHVVPDAPRNGVVATKGSLTAWLRTAWQVVPEGRGRDLIRLDKSDLADDATCRAALARLEPAHLRKAVTEVVAARLKQLGKTTLADAGLADACRWVMADAGGAKMRFDHRHHFIDAAVIAVTGRDIVKWVNTWHARSGNGSLPDPRDSEIEEPFPGFRAAILKAHAHLWPSHRPAHGNGGALHAETLYGVREVERDGRIARCLTVRKSIDALFKDAGTGKNLPDDKAARVIESFLSDSLRNRFMAAIERQRRNLPDKGLAELCLAAAAEPQWGPRGMTGNTILDEEIGSEGVVWPFRGSNRAAVKTAGNAAYEVWETRDGKGRVCWTHRVLTRFDVANGGKTAKAPPAGGRLVMTLRRGDLVWWPGQEGDRLFLVKKMDVTRGRLSLWPARYATGTAAAPFVQALFPKINLNQDSGYEMSSADALRKAGLRPATVSILGRLRVK